MFGYVVGDIPLIDDSFASEARIWATSELSATSIVISDDESAETRSLMKRCGIVIAPGSETTASIVQIIAISVSVAVSRTPSSSASTWTCRNWSSECLAATARETTLSPCCNAA